MNLRKVKDKHSKRELGHRDLIIFQSIAQDVVHVLVEPLKTAIT